MTQAIIITDPSHIEFIRKAIRSEFDKDDSSFFDCYRLINMARELNQYDIAQEMEKDVLEWKK